MYGYKGIFSGVGGVKDVDVLGVFSSLGYD